MFFLLWFIIATALSALLTFFVRNIAQKLRVVDKPDEDRKIHSRPTPLLGGFAPFAAFWLALLAIMCTTDQLPARYIAPDFLVGAFVGGLIIMVGGALDDKLRLRARYLLAAPLLAVLAVIASGVGIEFVSHPTREGLLYLNQFQWVLGTVFGRTIAFVLVADAFTVLWLMGMMFTTKLLDGLDGLVGGITTIGAFILFALSLSDKTFQPDVALFSIILAGAALGFLFWNTHPAKIFLGEAGSVWLGFMLGLLAIISGGKVATALLIMGIPILDVGWVILRRLLHEHRPVGRGDSKHLHFRLLTAGLSHRASVLLLWSVAALFGIASLFVQTRGKIYLLVVLVVVMITLAIWVTRKSHSSSSQQP